MKNVKGFTLVELMIVILIVGILASVAVPMMRNRVDAAKWSEGKAAAGTIATGLRAYAAEKGADGFTAIPTLLEIGIANSDLLGTYFEPSDYTITSASYDPARDAAIQFVITVSNSNLIPDTITLTVGSDGIATWSD